jgi:hypothetical protein
MKSSGLILLTAHFVFGSVALSLGTNPFSVKEAENDLYPE